MAKEVFKEIFIMLLLLVAVLLLFGVIFYDYIPTSKVIPNKVAYIVPEEVKEELDSVLQDTKDTITLTYEIDTIDLNRYKSSGSYVPGKVNPFEEYKEPVNNDINSDSNGSTNTENQANSNSTNTFYNDVAK